MRTINAHHTNDANKAIVLEADDRNPANGNASHHYALKVYKSKSPESPLIRTNHLDFQDGPIGETGVNGVTNEVLLAVLIDRLEGFQSSKWACEENARALSNVREALADLESRTKARQERGVEGTHTV
jgi:hypothetical protein